MYLPLVDPNDLTPELRAAWDIATPDGKRFVGVMAHAPEYAEHLFSYYNGLRYGSTLGMKISELCRLAAVTYDTRCAA
ncbi:MAG: hypothetical protein LC797_01955 [Chloroflexi bacterium]|nr:hypothetical protein [Chloroflexota bacterium]